MIYSLSLSALLPLLAITVSLLMIGQMAHRLAHVVPRTFFIMLLANSVWLAGDSLAFLAVDPETRWFWIRAQFLGILTLPVAWLVFIDRTLCPKQPELSGARPLVLLLIPAFILALIWTNGSSGLVWSSVSFADGQIRLERGLLFWLGVAGYPNLIGFWGVYRLLMSLRVVRGQKRGQVLILLYGAALVLISDLTYLVGVRIMGGVNLTPIAFSVTLIPIVWGMARYGLLRAAPVAHRHVVDHLPEAVIVVDREGTIIDLNTRAQEFLGSARSVLMDRELREVFPHWFPFTEGTSKEWRTTDGAVWEITSSTVRSDSGRPVGQVIMLRDITDRIEQHALTERLAFQDALTGLGNRRAFDEQLEKVLERTKNNGESFAVVMIDLDGMKLVNDREGHARGDALLKSFGAALESSFRAEDQLFRLGGDEFAAFMARPREGIRNLVDARVSAALAKVREGGFPCVSASAGVACWPEDGLDVTVVKVADERMYADKAMRRQKKSRVS
ncbi:histidine kinase N-terminal 7TM domain-containing diguanylate cyclase [Deinococcus peraridilitoris]|uniref:PAS domain S-box/diguanylate cyclase (GGDEF) domain-containing protein n=1 Tax=Deinococcus peraridilitoris (strain DSM 19664 / LMG 22246 / CIP 109416 / KR-200) TaxID=937777 RepID=L0A7F4_DEIPD|nr:histidine kinase N-terminal 7TM domain-containing protein [Deinococcus peraridilitoris]AFZ69746.1 PAS domain S-box/diguanylate cyclase (GGDEF) domain-containing protein [Deinococcus peraridilitoris DSM 19664]